MADKPRVRVQAGSDSRQFTGDTATTDTFQNFAAQMGYGTNNLSSASTYGFNPISRIRTLVEWCYRGSWLVRKIVDCPADDMTREGIQIESDMPPDKIDSLTQYWNDLQIWQRINSTIKWSRLYGGALGVIMIEGQKLDTPLRIDTVGKDQFKGILPIDRWMVWPHLEDPVQDFGADFGLPKYYDIVADARSMPNMRIHHSRCMRLDGIELPYWQRIAENLWGLSVIEPLWDRMIAFDSATQGAAQLIYKAHLRVVKMADYRENIALGGKAHQAVLAQLGMIRLMQSNEGLTVLDKEDDFTAQSYSFAGLSDMMVQFSQQISGAADVPMTRLFGQSPAGMNATGESDMRNYYDGIKSAQESRLRRYVTMLLHISHRSRFGIPLPDGFNYSFTPLWQMTPAEKSGIAVQVANATSTLFQDGILSQKTAMKEVRQSSRVTGFGSNITDEEINELPDGPPTPMAGEMAKAAAGKEPGMGAAPSPGFGHATSGTPGTGPTSNEQAASQHTDLPSDDEPGTRSDPEAEDDSLIPVTRGNGTVTPVTKAVSPEHKAEQEFERHYERRGVNPIEAQHESLEQHYESLERQFERDALPIMDVGPLKVVIETPKGERRLGYGWAVNMPAHYGYISGTSSAEGATEQMDAFVGDDPSSDQVWIISQNNLGNGKFDEHKCMLGCHSRDEALQMYHAAFSDGRGPDRVGAVRQMSVQTLADWLQTNFPYGKPNGKLHATH